MSKPGDIPPEVRNTVLAILRDENKGELGVLIARAILAAKAEERRQVIGVVLSFERHHGEPGAVASNPYADVREIAAAIRKREG